MRFIVSRTSGGFSDDEPPPCDGLERVTAPEVDARTFATEEEHDQRFPHVPWRDRGTNHRTWSGGICRDLEPGTAWVRDFATMADLAAFIEEHGTCILGVDRGYGHPDHMTLEIYDDYRE